MKFPTLVRPHWVRLRTPERIEGDSARTKSVLAEPMRVQLYGQLEVFLKSAAQLDRALDEMYKVYSENGKQPRNRRALVVREILAYMSEGLSFAVGISRFVTEAEFFLLAAGEKSGDLPGAFRQCVRLIKAGRRVHAATREAYAYNGFLTVVLVAFLLFTSHLLVPQAMQLLNGKALVGLGNMIYVVSETITYAGPWALVIAMAGFLLYRRSKATYTGKRRIWLDRHWPYATYRMLQGTTFLISLSSLTSAKVSTGDALIELAEHASPYVAQRLLAARRTFNEGIGLGDALDATGYEFPDRDAITHLRILGSRAGVETAISQFADDWLTTSLERIEISAKVSRTVGLVFIILMVMVVLLGLYDIQNQARLALGV